MYVAVRSEATYEVGMRASRSLDELYPAFGPRAKRLAFLLTGDDQIAQDLVQEAFARILGRFGNLRGPDNFDAYLRKTIVNLARRHYRLCAREREFAATHSVRDSTEMEFPDVETQDELWTQLQVLPARQRAALVLRYYEDLSEAMVADVLGCSLGAAKQLIARGVAALRLNRQEVKS